MKMCVHVCVSECAYISIISFCTVVFNVKTPYCQEDNNLKKTFFNPNNAVLNSTCFLVRGIAE
uniref:Uncharacterized protein n=1 Tax=Anguilla anguilla TaxID=7936 RepID=A0A0E9TZ80_ANGAN